MVHRLTLKHFPNLPLHTFPHQNPPQLPSTTTFASHPKETIFTHGLNKAQLLQSRCARVLLNWHSVLLARFRALKTASELSGSLLMGVKKTIKIQ
jgi:hypothetical protein